MENINAKEVNAGKVNASEINSQAISGDIIAINNEYGHFEIGEDIGRTYKLEIDKYILVFKGGILVDIQEKGKNDG